MWDGTHQTHGKTRGWYEDGLSSGRKFFLADEQQRHGTEVILSKTRPREGGPDKSETVSSLGNGARYTAINTGTGYNSAIQE